MIQVNATTHSKGGVTIATGSLLNVTPHFMDYVDGNGLTKYNISFDVAIYKNMASYLSGTILLKDSIDEYNIGYTVNDVDIQALTSIDDLLALLQTHIENGDATYTGVGAGNTAIVYPAVV